MKDKERDIFDDLFRSKLQDFEADTMPGDWEAIADRLPVKKFCPFPADFTLLGGCCCYFFIGCNRRSLCF